jgi:hypothetical protein
MRYVLLAALGGLGACATAGPAGSQPADAPPAPIDTFVPIDMSPPDAPTNTCASAATCQTAQLLGAVSGDTNNDKLTSAGTQAAWFRVLVTEDEGGFGGVSERVAARIVSPPGADFDVFVYVNPAQKVVECNNQFGQRTSGDEVKAEWGEGTFGNNSDDSRDVSIEVRPISGSCSGSQMWQLEVEGDWN